MTCDILDVDYELDKRYHLTTEDLYNPWDLPRVRGTLASMPLKLAIATVVQQNKLDELL